MCFLPGTRSSLRQPGAHNCRRDTPSRLPAPHLVVGRPWLADRAWPACRPCVPGVAETLLALRLCKRVRGTQRAAGRASAREAPCRTRRAPACPIRRLVRPWSARSASPRLCRELGASGAGGAAQAAVPPVDVGLLRAVEEQHSAASSRRAVVVRHEVLEMRHCILHVHGPAPEATCNVPHQLRASDPHRSTVNTQRSAPLVSRVLAKGGLHHVHLAACDVDCAAPTSGSVSATRIAPPGPSDAHWLKVHASRLSEPRTVSAPPPSLLQQWSKGESATEMLAPSMEAMAPPSPSAEHSTNDEASTTSVLLLSSAPPCWPAVHCRNVL
eukprot:3188007-Rhodomonas_salina.1